MIEELEKIIQEVEKEFSLINNLTDLENFRIKYLGRKGVLTTFLRKIKDLSIEEKKIIGKRANDFKEYLEKIIEEKKVSLKKEKIEVSFDYTLPGRKFWLGHKHPITQVMEECIDIFVRMGFKEEQGPEIEDEWHNFTALNIPPLHPARDMFSTFYLPDGRLLRSHTSPVQIRVMERERPPIRIIAPGRVFRPDDFDASHSPVFYQIEGLYVDTDVTFLDLKTTVEEFCRMLFGKEVIIKFTPSYFPFTEPSAEVSISCLNCLGKGCERCRNKGFLEILGCGMVHPQVLKNVNIDPEIYSGFAFGLGVERITMIKFQIDDIRLFYQNDIRFLSQF
ncbi:MAG: phenylalanine--tRNA ligase subunit alpha [candidate division WOR-3 bacterium]